MQLPSFYETACATSHFRHPELRLHSLLHWHLAHQYQQHHNTATMAETQGTRRSGRARKAVTTYAEEQAEQQSAANAAAPVKRKKPAAKASKSKSKGASTDSALNKPDSAEGEELVPPRKKAKKSQSIDEEEHAAQDFDLSQDEEEFKPAPKKARKKRTVPIDKLDSEGVMRLDTTEPRPKGERKPARVYPIPPKYTGEKGKSTINLAAILAESFDDRWQRQVSKIPRLEPGAQEVRLKE